MQIQGKIAFLHEDTPYIHELTTYMVCSNNLYFQIHEFHSTNEYLEQLASADSNLTKEFDVILLSEKIIQEECSFVKTCVIGKMPCIVLTEVFVLPENIDFIAENNLYRAVRYQSVETLSKYILSIIQKNKKWLMTYPVQERVKVIGVYSPSGGVGKTTVSIGMTDIYKKLGKKSIYIPLVGIEVDVGVKGRDRWIQGINEGIEDKKLTDWIFGLKSRSLGHKVALSKLLMCIQSMGSDRGDYLPPVEVFEELDEMNESLLDESIQLLKDHAGYEVIVLDIESKMTRQTLGYFRLCDEIWLISGETEMAMEKERIWKKQLATIGQTDFLQKCKGLVNQYIRQERGELSDQKVDQKVKLLPHQRQLCRMKDGQITVDMGGVFGESLMKMVMSESVAR